jgi:geranylgeranyl reductase family protein
MSTQHADVLIVGGGPAGASAALFLAHAAPELTDRILVVDKERFPREKYCAGGVGARADRLLGSIGVTVEVPSVWLHGVAFRAIGRTVVVREDDIGRVIRRIEFDHELLRTAERRGVRVLEGARVTSIARVAGGGFSVDTTLGEVRAKVVIGADGVQSVVRKVLGFESGRYRAQALEVDTEMVEGDIDRDLMLFDVSHRALPGYYWDFPTLVGGREMMVRGVYLLRIGSNPSSFEIQKLLEQELEARGLALGSYRKKRYAELAFDPHVPVSRPGVLLVGESAGIDPMTGEGIAQAIQYGAVAGRYLARKLRERELGFEDWVSEIRRTMIGRDLHVRTWAVPFFYGENRAKMEEYVLENPDIIRVGTQHFAGKPWSRRAMASAAWGAARHWLFPFRGERV